MRVASVTYHEGGYRTVGVACDGCLTTHQIRWPAGCTVLHKRLECTNYAVIEIPLWARNPRRERRGYRVDPAQPHVVSAGEDRDDNAMNEPVPNWTE
jgi:hypothetical protein